MNAVIDELGLVVEIHNGDAFGERPIDLSNLFLNPFDYLFGIFVDSLENDSGNNFTLAVFGDRALTDLVSDLHAGHVTNANRRTAARVQHDVLDIFDVFYQAQAT